jgi:hypothetical protein
MTYYEIKTVAASFANSGQPENTPVETPSSSEGTATTLLSMELPSSALSDVTVQTDCDSKENRLFSDMFSETGSGYSMFPGFDDFCGDFYVPEMPNFDYVEENMDGLVIPDLFLWNF